MDHVTRREWNNNVDQFQLKHVINMSEDGFVGTIVEIGVWNGHTVAIKRGVKKLHKKEAGMLEKIGEHINIVKLMKKYNDGDTFIVLEGINNGFTLEDIISKNIKLPLKTIVNIIIQIANGLKHIHSKGIIHHDIKPSNILIDSGKDGDCRDDGNINNNAFSNLSNYSIKICDFELAIEGNNGLKEQGTSRWMAPELNSDNAVEPTNKIDIYSLGVIFISLIFSGRDVQLVKYLLPQNIFDIMYKCKDENPANRPSLDEIVYFLENPSGFGKSAFETIFEGKILSDDEENMIQIYF